MTKYQEWLSTQSDEFKKFIHKKEIPESYRNENLDGIDLEELMQLDDRFINNPEGI